MQYFHLMAISYMHLSGYFDLLPIRVADIVCKVMLLCPIFTFLILIEMQKMKNQEECLFAVASVTFTLFLLQNDSAVSCGVHVCHQGFRVVVWVVGQLDRTLVLGHHQANPGEHHGPQLAWEVNGTKTTGCIRL